MRTREHILAEIKLIEETIKTESEKNNFGNPIFSEWYEEQVGKLTKLREELERTPIDNAS